ncbi:1-phosphatidylinositol 3-phosphate 5-kinase-like isoform X3 [Mizuhopecten yessoensis]|uniref:1-phosphatidylinositol 3-phosphate 5-kinase-like isoform X3 n=1 Tax=Mizuhopecten yessoensis TaxID=6573 RepID=UPI000B45878A|nr:1-phosphatidylinositol 3-phosphate 5-kinase-like isoform X3 [Mizuhopecten yessoensis]
MMAMWDDTPTTLTVFGPLSSEVSEGGNLFTRLWKRSKDDSSSSSRASSQKSSRDPSVDREVTKRWVSVTPRVDNPEVTGVVTEVKEDDLREDLTASTSEVEQQHGDADRTLSSVLNRLSNILERRTTTPQAYRDSDFKQYWMPDSSCKECYDCGDKFTTFRRRHHCRICGQIFCSKCCNQELPGKIIGYKGGIRVCTYCGKVAMSALQNEPSTGDLRVEREDLRLSMEYTYSGGLMGANSIWGSSKKQGAANKARGHLSMTSSTTSLDQMAPFDLTPQTDYQNFENLYMDRKFFEDSTQLRDLWKHISDLDKGVEMQSHRIRLRTYHKCIVGNKLVDWLIKNDRAVRRVQAVVIGQALLNAGYLEPASGQQPLVFQDDFTLYKPSETSPMEQPEEFLPGGDDSCIENTEPEWLQQIEMDSDGDSVSEEHAEKMDSFQGLGVGRKHKDVTSQASSHDKTTGDEEEILDFEPLPRQDNHGTGVQEDIITDSVFTSSQTQSGAQILSTCRGWRTLEQVKDENDEKASFVKLKSLHDDHLRDLVSQMSCDEGLSKSWMDIVLGTAQRVSRYVHPDVKHAGDHMDIRKYIKFKKIPGGNKEQTCVIHGLVFTKNVAHKKMAHQLTNPTILLLKGSIEYQRVESKFSSLEPQILQEEEFLRKNVSKISSMKPKPDIVVVEKSVSRLAQNFLLATGITLLYNVKLAVMERLERFTQATIISSIDGIVSGPINLGFCHNFKACNFNLPSGENKTMLCFDGCATHLGCTISLRGGSSSELKRIKKIMRHIIYAAYNSQLEISLLMDEFAMPPGQLDDSIHVIDSADSTPSAGVDMVDSINNSDAIQEWVESTVAEGGANESGGVASEEVGVANENEGGATNVGDVNCSVDGNINSSMTSVDDKSDKQGDSYPEIVTLESEKGNMDTEEVCKCSENVKLNDKDMSNVLESEKDTAMENDLKTLVEEGKIKFTLGETNDDSEQDQDKNESLDLKMDLLNCDNIGRKTSSSEIITDQSDPLHNFEKNQDDTIFQSSITLQEKSQKRYQKFRKLLNEVLLSTSPFVKYDVPFLESESGSDCCSRKYFAHIDELYWSCRFDPTGYEMRRSQKYHEGEQPPKPPMSWSDVEVVESHPFILSELTSMDKGQIESMLADFRARGGRIILKPPFPNLVAGPKDLFDPSNRNSPSQQNNKGVSFSGKKDRRRDCLEFHRHQRLAVLLSSHSERSANHPFPCLPPQIVTMEFYGNQDITLGGFLEKFCFRESYSLQPYTCPSEACDIPMLDHVRRIVHNNGAIYISLRKLKNCVPGGDSAIMMWNWCRKCRQATPLMPMSQDTWNISFAKYLELHFYGNSFMRRVKSENCTHSLHQTFSQYLGHKNIVTTFKYYQITKLEIALPHCVINLETGSYQQHCTRLREETKHLVNRGTDMYSTVLEYVLRINSESQNELLSRMVGDYITMIQSDKCDIRDQGRNILDKLQELETGLNIWGSVDTNIGQIDKVGGFYLLQDDLVRLKRSYADSISNWNIKLQELYSQHKKRQLVLTKKEREMSTLPTDDSSQAKYAKSSSEDGSYPGNASLNVAMDTRPPSNGSAGGARPSTNSHAPSEPVPITTNITETQESDVFVEENTEYVMSPTPGVALGISPGMAADNLTLEVERKGQGDSKSYNIPTVARETEDSLMLADTDVQKVRSGKGSNRLVVPGNSQKLSNSSDDQTDGQQTDRISGFKKTITNFLSGTGLSPLVIPVDASEHTVLPSCYRVPILVYDQEPSSIIAYALSCHDYHQKLQEIQTTIGSSQREASSQSIYKGSKSGDTDSVASDNDKGTRKGGSAMLAFLRGGSKEASPVLPRKLMDNAAMDSVKYTPKLDSDSIEIEEERAFLMSTSLSLGGADSDKSKGGKQSTSPHLELQFSDQTARFYCKVYFAEQFQQLRKLIFPAGEDMFIRSLSRCKVWEAKGGKSGSAFSKTDDDRFILKQMSGIEVDIFEKFGPEYFQHISKCYMEQKPTALAKIVGVYRIGFRNTHTNRALKQDVLIMENLFYNRKISQTFDLKGSNRNRLVNTSGKREEEVVLLDENLMKLSVESPLYVYPHSKMVLTTAIRQDSEFLSANLVMDYSLLVGLDEKRNELVVGIIDYIRTFTWDKKLETLIKSTGGKMPTVVSPEIYRTRFMEAMGRYFLPVPDQWNGLGRDTEL